MVAWSWLKLFLRRGGVVGSSFISLYASGRSRMTKSSKYSYTNNQPNLADQYT